MARQATPSLYTIPAGHPFADCFAAGLLESVADTPESLPQVQIFVPNRRAVRTLQDAFLRRSGGRPLLLPRMTPIGDLANDDDTFDPGDEGLSPELDMPPAIAPLKRQLLLTRRILDQADGDLKNEAQAAALAEELGRLIDQVHIERISFDKLADLVPGEFAEHWKITLDFLRRITHDWPEELARRGLVEQVTERDRAIGARIARWRDAPPQTPVFAAGSTGSMPATRDLLAAIRQLPRGAVVLPGLDTGLDAESWRAIDETHPQFMMKRLLDFLETDRDQVAIWPAAEAAGVPNAARAAFLSEAMRPAATTGQWTGYRPDTDAVRGLSRIDAPGPREEAQLIALKLRETLETPDKTAALVTPDRGLARRVAVELRRWNIDIDDSAGVPLHRTPPGTFLRLLADASAESLAPVPLLALLKHPLMAMGRAPADCRALARRLEREALRGARPGPGIAGLRALLSDKDDQPLLSWLDDLERGTRPLAEAFAKPRIPMSELLNAHLKVAETLAAGPAEDGAAMLWRDEAGETAARFFTELHQACDEFGDMDPAYWPALLERLMAGIAVRPRYGRHPRLAILGPLESRLQRADVMILGGLNEGTWPPEPAADPWMSRPMRRAFGLGVAERRIGQSAHDVTQAAAADEVLLTRSEKVAGRPTVPSRWLLRFDAVAAGPGIERAPWRAWQHQLDGPGGKETRSLISPPAPCPPREARPRSLRVTEVERWIRNPYAIYARHILGLKPLDPIDMPPGAAERGTLVHEALERFLKAYPGDLPDDPLDKLLEIGREVFAGPMVQPTVRNFWWPRFRRMADWFVERERERRPALHSVRAETGGHWRLEDVDFALRCRADRIELTGDGGAVIIDFKTGSVPTKKAVAAGFAPQLPLEAAMALAGAFEIESEIDHIDEVAYWKLTGGSEGGELTVFENAAELAQETAERLRERIRHFDNPKTPYLAQPRPEFADYGDYDHLARRKEWARTVGDGE